MNPLKIVSLAVFAMLLAMACVGATSAMAESTTACSVDEDPCESENIITHGHGTTPAGEKGTLLNSISNVLCDVLALGNATTALGSPAIGEGTTTFTNCTDEKPNPCTVEEINGPSISKALKEGHELASVVGEGEFKVVCSGISCVYNAEGLVGHALGPLLSEAENGEVVTQEQTVKKVKGLLCPSTAKLDGRVTSLELGYISS